jgi:GntR family transcriptional regulator, transcriptional repressor for pyruvate dehydrogenase complex
VAVTDEAILRIKEMIVSGELGPGDRLPREADLADRLGLSRNSLREAVKALSLIRVLDVRQGDGTYVTELRAGDLLEALSFVVDFHHDDTVLEVLEVRRILEPAATAMAAARISEDEIAVLFALCDAASASVDIEQLVSGDMEFHSRIARASGNAYLANLLAGLSGPTARARIWRGITQQKAASRTVAEHRAIVDALAGRQPEAARAWATVHVAGVEQWLRRIV